MSVLWHLTWSRWIYRDMFATALYRRRQSEKYSTSSKTLFALLVVKTCLRSLVVSISVTRDGTVGHLLGSLSKTLVRKAMCQHKGFRTPLLASPTCAGRFGFQQTSLGSSISSIYSSPPTVILTALGPSWCLLARFSAEGFWIRSNDTIVAPRGRYENLKDFSFRWDCRIGKDVSLKSWESANKLKYICQVTQPQQLINVLIRSLILIAWRNVVLSI